MDLTNLTNLISEHKNKIVNIIVIILALMIANNIYKNQATTIRSLSERKDAQVKKNEVLQDISQLEKKIKALKNAINIKDMSSIINKLTILAQESSVKISSLKPEAEKDYPEYIKYSFDLAVAAEDYHRIAKFISKIENSPDIYTIESMRISQTQEERGAEKGPKMRKAELTLSTILIKE